ncbi:MAG: cytochrome c [Candidatus Omnitrophica bacterium]|nr:cytochrome c [Candidatus Omnitrophota bacterium]
MTKGSARNIFIGGTVVAMAIFLVMTYLSHVSYPVRTHPENITEEVAWGKKVWEKHACIDCHTLLGEGAYYAPELGNVVARRGVEGVRNILTIASKQGWGVDRKMPQFDLSKHDVDSLVEFFVWINEVDTNDWPPNIEG